MRAVSAQRRRGSGDGGGGLGGYTAALRVQDALRVWAEVSERADRFMRCRGAVGGSR